jgi:hypothetical protein
MIAAAVKAGGELQNPPPRKRGRRRQYADAAARQRAWRRRNEIRDQNQPSAGPRNEPPDAGRDRFHLVPTEDLRGRLLEAAQDHIDPAADVAPISGLLDQGCDLEADVVPIVAREVPELPRPLKNWGAPWLVREILAAREQRLAGHRVKDPPPTLRTPAIEWDEFVSGYPKPDGHLREESKAPVNKAEPPLAIIYGVANPSTELGARLSPAAGATKLRPQCWEIGAIPLEWPDGIERLRVQARPREVPAHLWRQFVADSSAFLHSSDNGVRLAAILGWDQFSLFGCSRRSPVLDVGHAGLLWVLRGGQILRLHRDWAEYVQAGTFRTHHRRRVDLAQVTLPWLLR